MKETFTTTIQKAEDVNATGIRVPAEVISALGTQKKPKVKVSLNGYTYRSTVFAYGEVFMLPLSQEHRAAAGVQAGDEVEVTLELDLEPRTVEVPDDLAAALAEKPGATAAFDALSYTMRKEYVRQVNEAKAQETRTRRIAGIVAKLGNS
jgi:antitoxin component of MazEF toxin-antitoxin module